MKVDTHDGSGVSPINIVLIQASFCTGPVVSIGLVYVALLRSREESRRLVVREVQAGDSDLRSLIVSRVLKL